MLLTLKNFKCFTDATFEFPDDTNVLISAASGFGKSTIFDAIRFVFWGNSSSDIITFGTKKCEVKLTYKDLIFKRSKPNAFTITNKNGELIDNPTQFIETHIPKYPENFLSSTPPVRMCILEKISCTNTDIDDLKTKIKNTISTGTLFIAKINANINSTEKILADLPEPEDIECPEKTISITEVECKRNIDRLKNKEQEILSSLSMRKVYENDLLKYSNISANVEDTKRAINNHKLTIKQYQEKKYMLDKLSKKINKNDIELLDLQDELEEANKKDAEYSYLESQINNLWKKCTSTTKTKNIPVIESVLKKSSKTPADFKCPSCNVALILKDNSLHKIKECSDYDILTEIIKLLKEQNKIVLINKNNIERTIKEYETSIESRKEVDCLKEELSKIDIKTSTNDLKHNEDLLIQINLKEEIMRKLSSLRACNIEELEETREDISKYEKMLLSRRMYDTNLKIWENNEKNKKLIESYNKNLSKLLSEHTHALKTLEKIESLKKCVEEAQSKALKSLIALINKEVKYFCDKFFSDEIAVKIKEFKEIKSTKSTKPSIDIKIKYRGNEMKPTSLSSGEYARVELALNLVLYKLVNSKCPLLLDEVTANLDSELSTKIFNDIKGYFSHKNIFIIAHQVVGGIFDHIMCEDDLLSSCKKL